MDQHETNPDVTQAVVSDLPFSTPDLPGIGGEMKQSAEDFEVEEIPAYQPSGTGDHLFLWIEKRGVAADHLLRHLAKTLRVSAEQIGVAGMKDRLGVTRQFVSVSAICADRVKAVDTDEIHVLRAERHPHKLRTGHLRGNRFSILLKNPGEQAVANATAIAERIGQQGFPNYFGMQRFGHANETAQLGLDLLKGTKTPEDIPTSRRKFLVRLALSAAQSAMFNEALADRLTEGNLHRVLTGDVMQVVASGGMFLSEDAAVDQERFEQRQIVPTGPIFGPKMKQPGPELALREARLVESRGLQTEDFSRYKKLTQGTRRAFVVWPDELVFTAEEAGLRFQFSLPTGSYATVLLREFQKSG